MSEEQDRVAVVTGGTRGIGAAISTHLARHGAKVAAVYHRNTKAADSFAKMASNEGLTVSLHQANVGNPNDCHRVIDEILIHYKRIDYLVNNAGITRDRTAIKLSMLDWEAGNPHQPFRAVLHVPGSSPPLPRPGIRAHSQYQLVRRPDRPIRPGQLLSRQSRPLRPDQDARPRDRHQGHHRQLRAAGRDQDRDAVEGSRGYRADRHRLPSRCTRWARRTMWRKPSGTWCPTKRIT